MKPKLKNIQDVLKVLKKFEIPKDLYKRLHQVEFSKTKKKRKKKLDTIWKDYTIFLFARERVRSCIKMIQDKCKILSDETDHEFSDIKKYNQKKTKEKLNIIYHLFEAACEGFGIAEGKDGKRYLKKGQAEEFINSLVKKYGKDETKIISKLKSFKYDNSKTKNEKTIIKFPDKMDTAKAIVREKFYWEQRLRLYKSIEYRRHKNDKNPIHYKNSIDAMKNDDLLRKEFRVLYKRSMKLIKEKETYNYKFFTSYDSKLKTYWMKYWRFFSKIR
jgi:hypothetical protein|tara:strand:- start:664 stop:1482 length:819 start_codon:yes stop_codon:yes gene_type:complete